MAPEAGLISADDFGQDFEDHPVAEGNYDLRITEGELTESKKGDPMMHFLIDIEGDAADEAPPIHHYLMVPDEILKEGDSDDRRKYRLQMRNIIRFFKVFGYALDADFDPENAADLAGSEGSCFVTQEHFSRDDDTSDEVNRLRLPKA